MSRFARFLFLVIACICLNFGAAGNPGPFLNGSEEKPLYLRLYEEWMEVHYAKMLDCPNPDSDALIAIYNSLDGPNWNNNSGWVEGVAGTSCDPCNFNGGTWAGVVCNSDERVITLSLAGNGLEGTIPSEISELTELIRLYMDDNAIAGGLPASIGTMDELDQIDLANNVLDQAIPVQIGNLTGLTDLDLSNNIIPGTIPTTVGNMDSLEFLFLGDNLMEGIIPSQLGQCTNLFRLDLSNNLLDGAIPFQLGNLPQLQDLSLNGNLLDGNIPPQLGGLSELDVLDLQDNDLEGSIPPELGMLGNIRFLRLQDNILSGEIPASLGSLGYDRLRVQNNNLSGCLPAEFAMRCGDNINMSGNPLLPHQGDFAAWCTDNVSIGAPCDDGDTGTSNDVIDADCNCVGAVAATCSDGEQNGNETGVDCGGPDCAPCPCDHPDFDALMAFYDATGGPGWDDNTGWVDGAAGMDCDPCGWYGVGCNNGRVTKIDLYINNLTGFLPADVGGILMLDTLDLGLNDIGSSLPSEIGDLQELKYLDLSFNELTNGFPSSIGQLTALEYLNVTRNSFVGSLPGSIGNLSALVRLDISDAGFTGEMPESIGGMSSLEYFFARNTDITGEIPPSIGLLQNLTYLDFQNSSFTGSIPEEIGNCASLNNLFITRSNISGAIPESIGNLSQLFTLLLFLNDLDGEIPASLGNATSLVSLGLGGNNLTGSIPDNLQDLPNLEELDLAFNNLSGELPGWLFTSETIEELSLANNNFSGCYPNPAEVCALGELIRSDPPLFTDEFYLAGNPLLPYSGDYERVCDGDPQVGASCNDNNPNTENDIITDDCNCVGAVTSNCPDGTSITVINSLDAGPGSLRDAMECVSSSPTLDTIKFNIPGEGPFIINLQSGLPGIFDGGTVIDATTQPGWEYGSVQINNANSSASSCFRNLGSELGSRFVIRGLQIVGFSLGIEMTLAPGLLIDQNVFSNNGSALLIGNVNDAIISNNRFATNAQGNVLQAGNSDGDPVVFFSMNTGNFIVEGNLFASNENSFAIDASGLRHDILNNTFGLSSDGFSPLSLGGGIFSGLIEPTIESNVFANADDAAIRVKSFARENLITENQFYCSNQNGIIHEGDLRSSERPLITLASQGSISGTSVHPEGVVEVYLEQNGGCNQSVCQGFTLLGITTADEDGNWALAEPFNSPVIEGQTVTAIIIGLDLSTSEFSACSEIILPLCTTLVTTTADSGPGSLREAITCANDNPDLDEIRFDLPGTAPYVIELQTALPNLVDDGISISLEGSGIASAFNGIALSGQLLGSGSGLIAAGDDILIEGLFISQFPSNGISVRGNNATIGSPAWPNIIVNNNNHGIYVSGLNCRIENNDIGVRNLEPGDGNDGDGIRGEGADNIVIFNNVIGNNRDNGVYLTGGNGLPSFTGTITRNFIGTTGDFDAFPNLGSGVCVTSPGVNVRVGEFGEENFIGHHAVGVHFGGMENNAVHNYYECNVLPILLDPLPSVPEDPVITSWSGVTVTGTAEPFSTIWLRTYVAPGCGPNAGACQGHDPITSEAVDGNGDWEITLAAPLPTNTTITAISQELPMFNSSRFSNCITESPACEQMLANRSIVPVTLNDGCQALVTPNDIFTGDYGCLTPADFEITVQDNDPSNGPIIDGPGIFPYIITCVADECGGYTTGFGSVETSIGDCQLCGPDDTENPEIACPNDTVLVCSEVGIQTGIFNNLTQSEITDLIGAPTVTDNCPAGDLTVTISDRVVSLDGCGQGFALITWQVLDAGGNFNSCVQQVEFITDHAYTITLPGDEGTTDCAPQDPRIVTVSTSECSPFSITQTRDTTYFPDLPICFVVQVTWDIINTCEYDGFSPPYIIPRDADGNNTADDNNYIHVLPRNPTDPGDDVAVLDDDADPDNDPPFSYLDEHDDDDPLGIGAGGLVNGSNNLPYATDASRGFFRYTQEIKVFYDEAPVITAPAPADFCDEDGDCIEDFDVNFTVESNCPAVDVAISLQLDLDYTGIFDEDAGADAGAVLTDNGAGVFTVNAVDFPIGFHAIRLTVVNECGVDAESIYTFEITDCTIGEPECLEEYTVVLTSDGDGNGIFSLGPVDLITGLPDDCSNANKVNIFGPDQYLNPGFEPSFDIRSEDYDCLDVGDAEVRVYLSDDFGNVSFCTVSITVTDPNSVCPSDCTGLEPEVNAPISALCLENGIINLTDLDVEVAGFTPGVTVLWFEDEAGENAIASPTSFAPAAAPVNLFVQTLRGECTSPLLAVTLDLEEFVPLRFDDLPEFSCATDDSFPLPLTDDNGITGFWSVNGSPMMSVNPAGFSGEVVLLFTTDFSVCLQEYEHILTVTPEIVTEFEGLSGSICAALEILVLPTADDSGQSGFWSLREDGSLPVANDIDISDAAGETLTYYFLSTEGCGAPFTYTVMVLEAASAVFTLPDDTICAGEAIVPTIVEAPAGGTHQWSSTPPAMYPLEDGPNPSFVWSATGEVNLQLIREIPGCIPDTFQRMLFVEDCLGCNIALNCLPENMQSVTLVVPDTVATAAQEICLPVRAADFSSVVDVGFTLNWDTDALQFNRVRSVHPAFGGWLIEDDNPDAFGASAINTARAAGGWFFAYWASYGEGEDCSDAPAISIPDRAALFELCFIPEAIAENASTRINFSSLLQPVTIGKTGSCDNANDGLMLGLGANLNILPLSSADCSECDRTSDSLALVRIYNDTEGTGWFPQDNWLTDAPLEEWFGVYTNECGCVNILDLDGNNDGMESDSPEGVNMVGEISQQVRDLTQLEFLYLTDNFRHGGELTPAWFDLPSMKHMFIENMDLTEPLSPQLINLDSLSVFDATFNQWTFADLLPAVPAFNSIEAREGIVNIQPQDSLGEAQTFTVTAGTPFTFEPDFELNDDTNVYTWYRNGIALPSVTGGSGTLTIPNVGPADLGTYNLDITNPGLPALTLTYRPIELRFPASACEEVTAEVTLSDTLVCTGTTVNFSIRGEGGSGPYFITYRINGMLDSASVIQGVLPVLDSLVIEVVRVRDQAGCVVEAGLPSASVARAVAPPTVTVFDTLAPGCGAETGSLQAIISEGMLPYEVTFTDPESWQPTVVGNTIVAAGLQPEITYSGLVTDGMGCTTPFSFALPAQTLALNCLPDTLLILAANTDTITLDVFNPIVGECPPFGLTWSITGATEANGEGVTGLVNFNLGISTFTYSYGNQACSSTVTVEETACEAYLINLERVAGPTCGEDNGEILFGVLPAGNNQVYTWSTGDDTLNLTGLADGLYQFRMEDTVTDCGFTASFLLQESPAFGASCASSPVTGPGLADGEISLSFTGATFPVFATYLGPLSGNLLLNDLDENTATVNGLPPGIYEWILQDAEGCSVRCTTEVGEVGVCPEPIRPSPLFAIACEGEVVSWRGQDYAEEGTFTDTVLVAGACDTVYTLDISITPLPVLTYVGDLTVCGAGTTQITASGANSYSWYAEDTLFSNEAGVDLPAGTFVLRGAVSINCFTSDTLVITREPEFPLFSYCPPDQEVLLNLAETESVDIIWEPPVATTTCGGVPDFTPGTGITDVTESGQVTYEAITADGIASCTVSYTVVRTDTMTFYVDASRMRRIGEDSLMVPIGVTNFDRGAGFQLHFILNDPEQAGAFTGEVLSRHPLLDEGLFSAPIGGDTLNLIWQTNDPAENTFPDSTILLEVGVSITGGPGTCIGLNFANRLPEVAMAFRLGTELFPSTVGAEVCLPELADVAGIIRRLLPDYSETRVVGVPVYLQHVDTVRETVTGSDGSYTFPDQQQLETFTIRPKLNGDYLNGISILDVLLLRNMILGTINSSSPLSPYQYVAADLRGDDCRLSVLDLLEEMRLLAGVIDTFREVPSYVLVDDKHEFPTVEEIRDLVVGAPGWCLYPDSIQIPSLKGDTLDNDFILVKMGDISLNAFDPPLSGVLPIGWENQHFTRGDTVIVRPGLNQRIVIAELQLSINPSALRIVSGEDEKQAIGATNQQGSRMTQLWSDLTGDLELRFVALKDGVLNDHLQLLNDSQGATEEGNLYGLSHQQHIQTDRRELTIEVSPNPFADQLEINVNSGTPEETILLLYDATGRTIHRENLPIGAFGNRSRINTHHLPSGIYYLRAQNSAGEAWSKVVKQ